jgi:hypothetical protein
MSHPLGVATPTLVSVICPEQDNDLQGFCRAAKHPAVGQELCLVMGTSTVEGGCGGLQELTGSGRQVAGGHGHEGSCRPARGPHPNSQAIIAYVE